MDESRFAESRRESRSSADESDASSGEIAPVPTLLRSDISPGSSEALSSSRESRRGRLTSEETSDAESSAKKKKTVKPYQIKLLALTTRPYRPSSYRVDPTATGLCTPIKGKPYPLRSLKVGIPEQTPYTKFTYCVISYGLLDHSVNKLFFR